MTDPFSSQIHYAMYLLSRLSAPMFLVLAGICLVLSSKKRLVRQKKADVLKHHILRGVFLFFMGFAFNLIMLEPLFTLNSLHSIGLSIILLSPIALKPTTIKCLILALAVLFLSEEAYRHDRISAVLILFQAPMFPWIIFAIIGVYAGMFFTQYRSDPLKVFVHIGVLSSLLILCGVLLNYTGTSIIWGQRPSTSFIAIAAGSSIYLGAMLLFVFRIMHKKFPVFMPIAAFGRHALVMYFAHGIFLTEVVNLLGLKNKLTESYALLVLVLYIIASWVIIWYIEGKILKTRYKKDVETYNP